MTQEKTDFLLSKCLGQVEKRMGWGPAADWSTNDFESASEQILAATGTHLSVATLKRLFGVVKYDSHPTATTLNAVAKYIGHENWRAFTQSDSCQENTKPIRKEVVSARQKPNRKILLWSSPLLVIMIGFLGFNFLSHRSVTLNLDRSLFSFSSEKMVSEGVPNSVIFEYDASALDDDLKLYIQQSWDERLRSEVSKNENIHTSIYYYPGYFIAKLVAEDQILQEHNLYIKTNGWLPMIEQATVPVFLEPKSVFSNGTMGLSEEMVKAQNISMQPETPWVSFFNVREFDGLTNEDFVFETQVKNTYGEGAGVCQHSKITLLYNGGAFDVPLSIKGCVSELEFYDGNGKRENPSLLGVDYSDWVDVKLEFKGSQGKLFINHQFAYTVEYKFGLKKIVGLQYRFQGMGSVNFVQLSKTNGEVVYREDFDAEPAI